MVSMETFQTVYSYYVSTFVPNSATKNLINFLSVYLFHTNADGKYLLVNLLLFGKGPIPARNAQFS